MADILSVSAHSVKPHTHRLKGEEDVCPEKKFNPIKHQVVEEEDPIKQEVEEKGEAATPTSEVIFMAISSSPATFSACILILQQEQ